MAREKKEEAEKKPGRPKKNDTILSDNKEVLTMTDKRQASNQPEQDTGASSQATIGSVANAFNQLFTKNNANILGQYAKYNPFLQNERLRALNTYPATYTPTQIGEFLQQPQYHEIELRGASWSLSASQYLYYQILREAADIPLFKYYVVPEIVDGKYDANFEAEEKYVNTWLQKFNVYNTLKKVALEVKREGKVSYLARQSVSENSRNKKTINYVAWQKLPPQFVKLTGIGENGYIASLNFLMFMQPGFLPEQYPQFIQDIWYDLNTNVFNEEIVTNAQFQEKMALYKFDCDCNPNKKQYSGYLEFVGNSKKKKFDFSQFMYWVELPQDLCFTISSDNTHPWVAPDTMGLYTALQELTDYTTLAGLVASTPLTAVLTGQAEVIPQAQAGQDQTQISPHTIEAFQNYFDTMSSGNIQSFFAPFKDLKLQSLPNVPNATDIKTKAVQNFIATAGEGGIISATDKPSIAMIKGAQAKAASQYDYVTQQCATIINMLLEKHNNLKYKWVVKIWGDIYSIENQIRLLKDMAMSGASFVLPKLASAFDLTLLDVRSIGDYLKHYKVYDNFKPLMNSQSKTTKTDEKVDKKVGRPPLEEGDIENDNTAASKETGDNISEVKEFSYNGCILCGNETEEGELFCEDCKIAYGLEGEEV